VHYDEEVVDEVAARVAAGEWEPLDLPGRLVRIDTSAFPELAGVVHQVEAAARAD
jgi:hypothetical protein